MQSKPHTSGETDYHLTNTHEMCFIAYSAQRPKQARWPEDCAMIARAMNSRAGVMTEDTKGTGNSEATRPSPASSDQGKGTELTAATETALVVLYDALPTKGCSEDERLDREATVAAGLSDLCRGRPVQETNLIIERFLDMGKQRS